MILARVIGNCVSTVQHPVYQGRSVLVCLPVQTDGCSPLGGEFLSVDAVQAGVGDLVLVAREGNAAQQALGKGPFHSVILGIVDELVEGGAVVASGAHREEAPGV